MTNLHPATAANTAILALHHCRALLSGGSSDAAATRAITAFLLWARTELEAGRLIAVIAGAMLKTTGSAVLHSTDRLAPLERTELLFVYSTDPSLKLDLIAVLIAEAWLRGMASIFASKAQLRACCTKVVHLCLWAICSQGVCNTPLFPPVLQRI